jgi:hypothetical protein
VPPRSILERKPPGEVKAILDRVRVETPFAIDDLHGGRRKKIWDTTPMVHCSIIGTCLTAAALRQVFVKLRQPDAKTATDHALHSRGVYIAGKRDDAAKLLNKTIDRRHEIAIKRFAKATTATEVHDLWAQALAAGDIPGAYWAVLTHPATDRALVNAVFGEVHMLSHLVGSSNRLDIARLRALERQLGESADKIIRQEARLQTASRERGELLRKIETLEIAIGQTVAREQAKPEIAADVALVQGRLDAEKAHGRALAARLGSSEDRLRAIEAEKAMLLEQNARLRHENLALEAALEREGEGDRAAEESGRDLRGLSLLYVGGRPKLIEQLKAFVARRGGALLAHDGGIEDNPNLLPGLVSKADGAFFPMDCISHGAVAKVKKICRDAGKPLVPLKTASLASFIAAIGDGAVFWRAEV